MSVRNFVPQIWSRRLIRQLREVHVYGQPGVVNRDYEGEISQYGDTVRINSVGDVSISNYVANVDHAGPEELTDEQRTLIIDQSKMFNFQLDDVDRAQAQQAGTIMAEAFQSAAYGLSRILDLRLATQMAAGAAPALTIGSLAAPLAVTPANVYSVLGVKARTLMARGNVPDQGRFMIGPPELTGIMLDSDRLIQDGGTASVLNGTVGRMASFTQLESNNVPEQMSTEATPRKVYQVVFGTNQGASVAEQIVSVKAYQPERRFADAIKGLHVYGSKVLRPEVLGVAYVTL